MYMYVRMHIFMQAQPIHITSHMYATISNYKPSIYQTEHLPNQCNCVYICFRINMCVRGICSYVYTLQHFHDFFFINNDNHDTEETMKLTVSFRHCSSNFFKIIIFCCCLPNVLETLVRVWRDSSISDEIRLVVHQSIAV